MAFYRAAVSSSFSLTRLAWRGHAEAGARSVATRASALAGQGSEGRREDAFESSQQVPYDIDRGRYEAIDQSAENRRKGQQYDSQHDAESDLCVEGHGSILPPDVPASSELKRRIE